jgi:hypothetical protein
MKLIKLTFVAVITLGLILGLGGRAEAGIGYLYKVTDWEGIKICSYYDSSTGVLFGRTAPTTCPNTALN